MLNGNFPFVYFGYFLSETQSRCFWLVFILFIIVNKLKKKIKFKPIFVWFYLIFLLLIFIQNDYLNSFFFNEFINLSLLFTISYLIIYAIGIKGILYLPRLTVKIIKFSLIFYLPSAFLFLFGIDVLSEVQNFAFHSNGARINSFRLPLHLIFHNFSGVLKGYGENALIPRNSGFYWEPGAFAGTIVMMFIIILIYKKYYSKKQFQMIRKWLSIGIISTFSTTGLILLPFLLFINYAIDQKISLISSFKLIVFALILIPISIYFFNNIPVLKEKIFSQIEIFEEGKKGAETSRIGASFFLFNLINEKPIIGHGFAISPDDWKKKLYYKGYSFEKIGIGNGLLLMLAWTGIPYVLFLIFLIGYNIKKQKKSLFFTLIIIGILLIVLQGESWFRYPLIYLFCFLPTKNIIKKQ